MAALAGCAPKAGVATPASRLASAHAAGATAALTASMDPSMRALAARHDPSLRQPDLWGRPAGWASLDITQPPDLGLSAPILEGQSAEDVNALRPFSNLPIRPMRPFVLAAVGEDRTRAELCLAQAIYYEAAREGESGQAAIAQVVLNRVRHPAYPKTVCGVVYQGAARPTGCQFTFTCDGALRWAPEPALWAQARRVARRALAGYVDKQVGSATHYHAQYVAPYWAPTLVKMTQVGQHIFYRWTGPWGEPRAFTGRYAGGEAYLSQAVLGGVDQRTQGLLFGQGAPEMSAERRVTIAVGGEVRTYKVADASLPGGQRTRVLGTIYPTRRQPTPDEVRRINDSLAALDQGAASASSSGEPSSAHAPGN